MFLITETRDGSCGHSFLLVPAKLFYIWKGRSFSSPIEPYTCVFAARKYDGISQYPQNTQQKSNQYVIGALHSPMQCISCMQDYSTEGMSENQLRILQHLREFGLVYQRKVHIYNTIY